MRAKTRESERLSYAQNPAAGTMLAAPAGGQAEAEFDFYNDSPDVASFYLEVDGLGPDWASGVGTAYEAYAPSAGGGQLRLTLTPPIMSAVGEYDFRVRLMSGGAPVNDGTALILRVDPPLEQPAEPFAPPSPVETEAPAPPAVADTNGAAAVAPTAIPMAAESAAPKTRAPRTRAASKPVPPEPVSSVPEATAPEPTTPVAIAPIETPLPVPAPPKPQAIPEVFAPAPAVHLAPAPAPTLTPPAPRPTPVQPPSWQQSAPVQPTSAPPHPPAEPQPEPVPPPVQSVQQPMPSRSVSSTPSPTPSRPTPAPVAPSRPAPTPLSDEPVLIDYNARGANPTGQTTAGEEEDATVTEPFLLDPKDGILIPLRPGETVLLRFPFVNEAPGERTYILDEDRALEDGWLTLVQDQVNLTRNGQGELSVRLTPPVNADPGDYPFTITTGPQGGQILPRVLTLSVLATPAVLLTTKDKTVKIGPFPLGSDVVFPLSVESAGNADTSFRIAVKTPQNEATDGGPVGSGDVYENGPWRYLFDKEMETLRSPMTGQTPRPVPVALRLRRKGIWWFGFKEQHLLRVAAVPVTEPGNGGKVGNSLDLVAVRTRLLPFPLLLLIPILLLLTFLASGGPTDLSVTNPAYSNGTECWIVDPKDSSNKNLELTWVSKSLALLRFTGAPDGQQDKPPVSLVKLGSGSYNTSVPVSSTARDVIYRYRISRLLGGAVQDLVAHFIYTSNDTPMLVTDGDGKPLLGDNPTLLVPSHGLARLNIKNGNHGPDPSRLNWWIVRDLPDTSAYKIRYHLPNESREPGQSEQFKIERNPATDSPAGEEQIVFVTTDATRPVLTVSLKPAP